MPPHLTPGAKMEAARITRHYRREAGSAVAGQFVAALRSAQDHAARHPEAGSPRFASATGLEGLRFWPLRGFPYLMFYRDTPQGPEVMAILHSARDIPATLRP